MKDCDGCTNPRTNQATLSPPELVSLRDLPVKKALKLVESGDDATAIRLL
jgi:hypothetical protein